MQAGAPWGVQRDPHSSEPHLLQLLQGCQSAGSLLPQGQHALDVVFVVRQAGQRLLAREPQVQLQGQGWGPGSSWGLGLGFGGGGWGGGGEGRAAGEAH